MSLLDHSIWWQVYPLAATGAPMRPETSPVDPGRWPLTHRLGELERWLDYVIQLGCSGLLLGPIFASVSHGYDTLDHYRIDPRLGDDGDFDHLVSAARSRGIHVVLDGVFNHVSQHHPLVLAATSGGDGSSARRMIKLDTDGHPVAWEGHGELIELRHEEPRVRALVAEVMVHWLRRGIAGWRLDVAYALPSEFWAEVLGDVRREFPDALFVGEVLLGDLAVIAHAGTLDSVTQYELWKGIWSSLKDRNLWELAWALERHEQFSERLVTQTFIGNHDVDRIASTVGDTGAVLAAALLLTLPGMPSIYYGDEQAFRGQKGEGVAADDALRPPLPGGPEALTPHGAWMHRLYRSLIALRRQNPWLVRARVGVVSRTNTELTYDCSGSGHVLRTELSLDGEPRVRVRVDDRVLFSWPE